MSTDEHHHGKMKDTLHTHFEAMKANKICEFREVGINKDTIHSISLQLVGRNTAGVYIARAISNSTACPLFHAGRPFILKLYNAEAAEGTLKNLDIKLSDELMTAYFDLKESGRLQNYMDHLCQQIEVSSLPAEITQAFYQDSIPKAELAWYLIAKCSTFDGCPRITRQCEDRGYFHYAQKSPVYRLALAMYCIVCARHKEIAIQSYLKQYNTSGILPSMISELKLHTESRFLGSMVSDAVAMEMFEGITLLDAADSIEAKSLFARWSNHDLQRGLQDIIQLGTCLLPLGLQQFDCYAQNIYLRFDARSGYITTSWIDVESLKPVQGNLEAKKQLDSIVLQLLEQQHSYPENHFRLSIDGFGPRLACVKPDVDLEQDLCLALEKFYYEHCIDAEGQKAIRGECRMTYYDTNLYRRFPHDLLTTILHWTIMQSACKAFHNKLHLVTVYLQLIRYMIDFHLDRHGTYCHCWARATFRSISQLHRALGVADDSRWECVAREIVGPTVKYTIRIETWRASTSNQSSSNGYRTSHDLACEPCKKDLRKDPTAAKDTGALHKELECLMISATQTAAFADALVDVESQNDTVTEFLSTISIRLAKNSSSFQALEGLQANMSRAQFVTMIENGTRHVHALDDWRVKVFPAF